MKKNKRLAAIGIASIMATASIAFASGSPTPDAILKAAFPKLHVDSIEPSAVKGIYEVIAGGNVLYFDPSGRNIIFGEVWSASGENLTAKARDKISTMKYKLFKDNLANAVKIGNGKHEVIEIIDPDCPYCRQMGNYWNKRNDVTRYVFFLPLTMHPNAVSHSNYIMSATKPAAALEEVVSGKYDTVTVPSFTPSPKIAKQAELAAKSGISGTPAYYVNGSFVNGANVAAVEKIIGKE